MQDIKHREWAATRKLDKTHADFSAANYDIEFTFSGRLTKQDPEVVETVLLLGSSDYAPVAPDGKTVEAPLTCQDSAGLAGVVQQLFCNDSLHSSEVCGQSGSTRPSS